MDRSRVLRHWLIVTTAVIIAAVGCLANDSALNKLRDEPPSCPQEMCVFLFDRLEEQSIRLRKIEDALLRVVSILAPAEDQEFSAASAALKSDPLLDSLLAAATYDPVDSIALFSDQMSNSLESPVNGRKKRQIERQFMSPKERLAEALKWTKKSSSSTIQIPAADTMEIFDGFKTSSPNAEPEQGVDVQYVKSDAFQERIEVGISFPGSYQRAVEALMVASTTPRTTIRRATTLRPMTPIAVTPETAAPTTTTPTTTTTTSTTRSPTSPQILTTIAETTNTTTVPTIPTIVWPALETNATFLRINPTKILPDMDQLASKRFVIDAVDDLQSAMKCALAQLGGNSLSEPTGVLLDPQAILNENGTLTIQFELKSCQKHWQAVWVRIFLRNEFLILRNAKNSKQKDDSHFTLRIPKECLKKSENIVSFTLPSTSKGSCSFPLFNLMECKIYTVEIIPVYLTLLGQTSVVEITVPPRLTGNSTDLVSLEQASTRNSTHILELKWSVRSGDCAQLMTSAKFRIFEDESDSILRSFTVPTDCIGNAYQNSFSATFSSFDDEMNSCRDIAWEPLDLCRKYKLEVEPEYGSLWRGNSSSLEIFTSGADRSNCCYMQTSASGILRSVDHDGNSNGCTWLIVVEKNSTIWLTFTDYAIGGHYHVKVYDGPYSTSPLLSQHYGNQPPQPIRSRSNKLFVQLVPQYLQYYANTYGKHFKAHYISVKNTRTPYVAGCGGYIVNTGTISKPAYPPSESSTAECLWYIESIDPTSSTLITSASGGIVPFPIVVYDGWSEDGALLYNGSSRASIYSYGRKALVKFPAWNSLEREREYSWMIYSISSMETCWYNLTGPSDSFSSHKDNTIRYSSLLDCRWTIRVDDSSNIRLTFVYFHTKRDHDFVSVYDGPTLNSSLLVELSGQKSKPISLTSKSSELLVRFTTDANNNDSANYKGFLAFYTTVPCDTKAYQTIGRTEDVLDESRRELKSVSRYGAPSTTEKWNGTYTTYSTPMFWGGTTPERWG